MLIPKDVIELLVSPNVYANWKAQVAGEKTGPVSNQERRFFVHFPLTISAQSLQETLLSQISFQRPRANSLVYAALSGPVNLRRGFHGAQRFLTWSCIGFGFSLNS